MKIPSGTSVVGEGGVAGERKLVGVPKFYSWDKCILPLTNIQSNWMSNASSSLYINVLIEFAYIILLIHIFGCSLIM